MNATELIMKMIDFSLQLTHQVLPLLICSIILLTDLILDHIWAVYKTQGLTLPHFTISLDTSMFANGQAYVAISRATLWQNLDITYFNLKQIKK